MEGKIEDNKRGKRPLVESVSLNPIFDNGAIQQERGFLESWALKRNRNNRPVNIVFTGEGGSGKSYSAIRLALNLDPNFSLRNIVFDTKAFLNRLNSNLPPGSVIVYEEAGNGLNAKRWHDEQVIIFGETAETMRYRGYMVFFTVPRLPFIDSTTRQLVQMLLESTSTKGRARMLFITPSADRNDNKPWYQYPKYQKYENYRMVTYEHRYVNFAVLPRRIAIPYEEKKDRILSMRYRESEKILLESEKDSMNFVREKGIRLTCKACSYQFQYTKAAWKVKCPRCSNPIDIPPGLKPFVGTEHDPLVYAPDGSMGYYGGQGTSLGPNPDNAEMDNTEITP